MERRAADLTREKRRRKTLPRDKKKRKVGHEEEKNPHVESFDPARAEEEATTAGAAEISAAMRHIASRRRLRRSFKS